MTLLRYLFYVIIQSSLNENPIGRRFLLIGYKKCVTCTQVQEVESPKWETYYTLFVIGSEV